LPARYDSLLFGNEIQLFNSASQHFSVDFLREIVTVGWTLEVQFIVDRFAVKLAFTLAAIAAHPLKSVVLQELFHFLYLLFELILLCNDPSHLLVAVFTCCLHQQLVLVL
jgi:hypothetical protein